MSMFSRLFLVLLFAALGLGAAPAEAQLSWPGAERLALGDASRAAVSGHDAIEANPAGILTPVPQYRLDLGYLDDFRGSDRRLRVSLLDSQAGPLAGALGYTYVRARPDGLEAGKARLAGHRVDLSFAALASPEFGLGITGRYLNYQLEGLPGGASPKVSVFNLDAGFRWMLTEMLWLGVVGKNLVASDRPEMPISVGGGLAVLVGPLTAEADFEWQIKAKNRLYALGASYLLLERVPLRVGLQHTDLDKAWKFSAGVGYHDASFEAEIGYQIRVNPKGQARDRDAQMLVLSLGFRFL